MRKDQKIIHQLKDWKRIKPKIVTAATVI